MNLLQTVRAFIAHFGLVRPSLAGRFKKKTGRHWLTARPVKPQNHVGVDQAVVSPAAISITAMAPWRSRPNCSGLDEAA